MFILFSAVRKVIGHLADVHPVIKGRAVIPAQRTCIEFPLVLADGCGQECVLGEDSPVVQSIDKIGISVFFIHFRETDTSSLVQKRVKDDAQRYCMVFLRCISDFSEEVIGVVFFPS